MAVCQICMRGARAGNNVSHSKRRTKTRWMPNVQKATIEIDGTFRTVNICTRCLRTQHKAAMKD